MVRRYYSSVATVGALTAPVNSSATVLPVSSVTGWPTSTPFTLVLDRGTTSEEIVTATAVAGLNVTVTRGDDGSAAQSHSAGAEVRHMMTGRDLGEPQAHIDAPAGVHGLAVGDAVVGTNATQTLKNKTLSATENAITNLSTGAFVDNAVTTPKLAPNSVTGAKIADGAVGTAKVADSSITSAKIADGTIAAGDLGDGAVTTPKIVNEAVTADKIDNDPWTTVAVRAGFTASPLLQVRRDAGHVSWRGRVSLDAGPFSAGVPANLTNSGVVPTWAYSTVSFVNNAGVVSNGSNATAYVTVAVDGTLTITPLAAGNNFILTSLQYARD